MNKDKSSENLNSNKQTIGDFLHQKRIKDELTLRAFCLKYEVDAVFISKLERNKLEITDKLIPILAKLYNVSESDLMNTNWEVDRTIDFPAFVPSHITTEEQLLKLLNVINGD